MKQPLLVALAFAILVGGTPTRAAPIPPHIEIKYRVSMGSMKIGEGLDVFEHDTKSYTVVSESKTVGLAAILYQLNLRREAKGRITREGLRPRSFVESRNGKTTRSALFDWEANEIELSDGSEAKQTVPLPPNTWDATSFAWNFAFFQPANKDLNINLTDGRRVTSYRYVWLATERNYLPVRIRYTEKDGTAFDSVVEAINVSPH